MPILFDVAVQTAVAAQITNVSFICADLLTVDLSCRDVVLLASQCWDQVLLAAVRTKLLCELRDGALVLDYSAQLGEQQATECERSDLTRTTLELEQKRGFQLVSTVRAPVSWDREHAFWVWRVVDQLHLGVKAG